MVKLRPHKKSPIFGNSYAFSKLNKRYYGPNKIVNHISKAAYKLELPEGALFIMFFIAHCLNPSTNMQMRPTYHCLYQKPLLIINPLSFPWSFLGHDKTR